MSSEPQEFVAPYLLPSVIEDLIISYTQRNNEQVGYYEPMAHMPESISALQDEKSKPPIGTIGISKGGARSCVYIPANLFVVVRNEEWPKSLQVVCPYFKRKEQKIVFLYDLVNYKSPVDPLPDVPGGMTLPEANLDDYMFTVVELDKYMVSQIDWRPKVKKYLQSPFKYDRIEHRERQKSGVLGVALNATAPGQWFDIVLGGT